MDREKFIKEYCKNSKITREKLLLNWVVIPCNCDYEHCKGWQVVQDENKKIKNSAGSSFG